MSFIDRLRALWARHTIPPPGLARELYYLERAIQRTDNTLSDLAGEYGPPGHCCPDCASAEYRYLGEKQERRYARRQFIENKLKRRSENG